MLMPGLIDAHMHPGGGGESLIACNLGYVSLTVDEILDQIKVCLANEGDAPDDQWLRVHAWFRQATKPEGADLTAAILDQLPTKRPVVVLASDFHTLAANTAAMKVANINASTPSPSDGEIVRDRTGAATGIFLDGAMWAVIGAEPKLPPEIQAERALENIRAAIAEVNSQGVTAIFSAGGGDEVTLTAWNKLFDSGALRGVAHPRRRAARSARLGDARADRAGPLPAELRARERHQRRAARLGARGLARRVRRAHRVRVPSLAGEI
jgi:predicted amidohydrolase YtcJ